MAEWRGADALDNPDTATNFWSMVTKQAKPEEFVVGLMLTLEVTHDGEVLARNHVRVTEIVDDDKGRHVQYEKVSDDEFEDSGIVVVMPV